MYFDDVSAWLVAEPTEPIVLIPSSSGDLFSVSFLTERGVRYEVLHTGDLTNSAWSASAPIMGNGGATSVTREASAPAGYYKVYAP